MGLRYSQGIAVKYHEKVMEMVIGCGEVRN
jgi:hypothetical protein